MPGGRARGGEAVESGWCAQEISEELPGLGLSLMSVEMQGRRPDGPSNRSVRQRLELLSDRFFGARAVAIRSEPVPSAYRVFFRQVGLDPEQAPTPLEAAIRDRLIGGRFAAEGLLADALLVALLETGVPIWALDGDSIDGSPGIRVARPGEPLGRGSGAAPLAGGELVLADASTALSVILAEPASAHRVTSQTTRLLLYALHVGGVPSLSVEEAMWICRSALLA